MSGYVPPQHESSAQLTFIPHASQIVFAGLFIVTLALLLWRHHMEFVKACTCQKEDD